MTSRRGFLAAMFAAAAAPAIVRAESLMKIVVPKQEIILPAQFNMGTDDFTIEAWVKPDGEWHHHSMTRGPNGITHFLDGAVIRPTKGQTDWITLTMQKGNVDALQVFRGKR